jgi:hypothetical protein
MNMMTKRVLTIFLGVALTLGACARSGVIEARDAWARSAPMGGNSAAYLTLVNRTGQDDELLGASSDAARAVEIHLSQAGADGMMQMAPQESVAIRAGEKVELKPGGYHIMLIGLGSELKAGGSITLTLHFRNSADLALTLPVRDASDMGGSGMDGHNMP